MQKEIRELAWKKQRVSYPRAMPMKSSSGEKGKHPSYLNDSMEFKPTVK